ncbi:MAG TPA: trehalose-phosphatase [Actinomycetota bacterium]|jgi:trehalose 6-phosphate phosphatase|nr:trehalose-phosphatase [Actinomycetota bacterium]
MSLAAVSAHLAEAAILLDFDGTLAPIVDDPAAARPLPEAVPVLTDLCRRAAAVAVITGRPEAFVRDVLDVPRLEVVGLYGLSAMPPLGDDVRQAIAAIADDEPGAEVEDKQVSIVVHTRRTPDPDAALARVREPVRALAASHGLTSFDGKFVIEVAPPAARKGGAVQQLLDQLTPRAALYAGDDVQDIEAFDALERSGVESCRVVVVGSGTPERLIEVADIEVDGPLGLLELLHVL